MAAGAFPTTRWTLVVRAQGVARAQGEERTAALDTLLAAYWQPLYVYARRKGLSPEDAQEIVQELFADLLERHFPEQLDPARGRLRGWLKACLDHHLVNRHAARTAKKRGGGARHVPLDTALVEHELAGSDLGPEEAYAREWAARVMSRALARLWEEQETRTGSIDVLRRFFGTGPPPSYREAAAEAGMSLPQLKAFLHRARVRYRELVLDEVRDTVAHPEDVEREMGELCAWVGL